MRGCGYQGDHSLRRTVSDEASVPVSLVGYGLALGTMSLGRRSGRKEQCFVGSSVSTSWHVDVRSGRRHRASGVETSRRLREREGDVGRCAPSGYSMGGDESCGEEDAMGVYSLVRLVSLLSQGG
jgi:hypothetical protein